MDIRSLTRGYKEEVGRLGKSLLHTLYPHDFEVYMMALELTDSNGNTIDYLSFPVMPDSVQKTELKRTNIKQTSGGVTVLTSTSFTPEEIVIKGNFGRAFKINLGKSASATGVAFSTQAGKYSLHDLGEKGKMRMSLRTPFFNAGIKTGYGATKVLQAIVSKSNGVDHTGRPFRLYFYNMALGESYLVAVPPSGLQLNMSSDKNMIWEYTLNLTTIAPLSLSFAKKGKTSLSSILATSTVQNALNKLGSNISNTLRF